MGWGFGYGSEQEAVKAGLGDAKVLRQARGKDGVWVVVKWDGSPQIVLVLIEREGGKFGAKVISEQEGPRYWDCPMEFLSAVPCPKGAYAVGWRQEVMARNGKRVPLAEVAGFV